MLRLQQEQRRDYALLNAKRQSQTVFARTHLAMRLAVLFGIALAMLAPRVEAAALQPEQDPAAQVVVLLPGRSLHERRLPALIQIQPGRYMLASTLERVCAKLMPRADSLLMFLPASRSCEMVDAQARVTLRQRLRQLTGRWLANGPQSRLREQSFVVVAPAPTLVNQSASCTCPNKPPNGVSMCTAQARTTGQPIGTVE